MTQPYYGDIVWLHVKSHPGVDVSEIAEALSMGHNRVYQNLVRLTNQGHIQKGGTHYGRLYYALGDKTPFDKRQCNIPPSRQMGSFGAGKHALDECWSRLSKSRGDSGDQ